MRRDSLGWPQGLGYITPAYPRGFRVSGLLRGKLGRHVGLPDRCISAAGAKAHCCGGLCRHAPRAAGVRCSDAGNLSRPSGEVFLGLGNIPLIVDTTKPVGSRWRPLFERARETRQRFPLHTFLFLRYAGVRTAKVVNSHKRPPLAVFSFRRALLQSEKSLYSI